MTGCGISEAGKADGGLIREVKVQRMHHASLRARSWTGSAPNVGCAALCHERLRKADGERKAVSEQSSGSAFRSCCHLDGGRSQRHAPMPARLLPQVQQIVGLEHADQTRVAVGLW